MSRLPIVGVMGSGAMAHEDKAVQLGAFLAESGVNLLTGGGGGVMGTVSQAFYQTPDRKGRVIGIVPGTASEAGYIALAGYPNTWVEIAIYTHLPLSGADGRQPLSRNHINVLSSNLVIALPGSSGTASEVLLARHYQRPVICWLDNRTDIPGLPQDIAVSNDFESVKQFVNQHLQAISMDTSGVSI